MTQSVDTQALIKRLLYRSICRFAMLLLAATGAPILVIALLTKLPSQALMLGMLTWLSMVILGALVYTMVHHRTLQREVIPLGKLAELGQCASRVAHDLRGPMTSMQAAFPGIQKAIAAQPEFADHFHLLQSSTERMRRVAEDLLQDYKEATSERRACDIHVILDRLIQEYQLHPRLRALTFTKQFTADPIMVHGYAPKLERLFANILKNGMEAMEFQGVFEITTAQDATRLQITMRDTGPGMTDGLIATIMTQGVSAGKKEGHGIGLAYVRDIVEQHHGHMRIESSLGAGTAFHITLPLAQRVKNKHLLVIDGDKSNAVNA